MNIDIIIDENDGANRILALACGSTILDVEIDKRGVTFLVRGRNGAWRRYYPHDIRLAALCCKTAWKKSNAVKAMLDRAVEVLGAEVAA